MESTNQNNIIIQSIDELITELSEEERTRYSHILRSMSIPVSDFESHGSWSSVCYTRNCIVANEKFELILLCWEAGQITPIHDHGGEECWVKIIQGEFKEVIYQNDESNQLSVVRSGIAKANDITYMIDSIGFHSLENISSKRSMSLHLYAKPIPSCKIFDENSKRIVNKKLVYDKVS